jgi:hypothetical protein
MNVRVMSVAHVVTLTNPVASSSLVGKIRVLIVRLVVMNVRVMSVAHVVTLTNPVASSSLVGKIRVLIVRLVVMNARMMSVAHVVTLISLVGKMPTQNALYVDAMQQLRHPTKVKAVGWAGLRHLPATI